MPVREIMIFPMAEWTLAIRRRSNGRRLTFVGYEVKMAQEGENENGAQRCSCSSAGVVGHQVMPCGIFSRLCASEESVARSVQCCEDEIGTDALHYTGAFQCVEHLTVYVRKTEVDAA